MSGSRIRAFSWRITLLIAGIFLFLELIFRACLPVPGFPAHRYVHTVSVMLQTRAMADAEFVTYFQHLPFTPATGEFRV